MTVIKCKSLGQISRSQWGGDPNLRWWLSPWICDSSKKCRGVYGVSCQQETKSAVCLLWRPLLKSQDTAASQDAVISRTRSSSYCKVLNIISFTLVLLVFFQIKSLPSS